jgi:AAA15 family ATPase/GTPase
MLVLLCDVAAAEPGGVVAIDEPENALHPFAIREFLRRAEQRARQHDLTVVLTTHSPVVLNHFTQEPSRIHVLRAMDPSMPVRLDEIKSPEWLADFCLGDLYENCEFGANDGEV